jgi:cytochrome c peroxidase
MIQHRSGAAAALLLAGCIADAVEYDDEHGIDPIAQVTQNEEEQNNFRNRKTQAKALSARRESCRNDPRVALQLVSLEVCLGADLFFREPFGGNGRACGSCHTAQFDFTISPEFLLSLAPDDPLFVAETTPALAQLERPDLMRRFGLILENVDGAEAPTTKFVMRSVPHTFSLTTSIKPAPVVNPDGTGIDGTTQPPNERTGWAGDGAPSPGGLQHFQAGAIFQHYTRSLNRIVGVDFVTPTDEQLRLIEQFLLGIGRSKEVVLSDVRLTDPGAEAGRLTFLASRCNGCHRDAGANVAAGFNRNFDTGVERVRIGELNTLLIPRDGGFGAGAPNAPFNHDADGDGIADSFGNGTFNTPPLIEAADTGPFFHTNAFNTIEQAITFYTTPAFGSSPAGAGAPIALSALEIANMGKLLRALNASFNCKLAIARLAAAVQVTAQLQNRFRGVQLGLLDAAQAEVRDALAVLSAVSINAAEQAQLRVADAAITTALGAVSHTQRLPPAQAALTAVRAADSGLGSGLGFGVGTGSIMF